VKSKRLTAFVLAFLMIFTSFGTMAFADTEGGSDISGHWAEASIQKWVEAGVINGYSDGTFRPDNGITRAEFVKIVNGLLGFKVEGSASFTDVASGEWYAAEVKKAVHEEFVSGYEDGSFRPDKGITRQEAAKIIDTILDMEGTDEAALNSFGDKSSVPDWSKNSLMYMVQKGYLSGYPDNTLRPTYGITRAETVALLDRVAGTVYSQEGTFGPNSGTETVEGNVTVTADGVTLKNTTITGDLHITAGVGDGDATFEDVTVNGETIINGGGMSTVTFKNTNLSGLVITKQDGDVRILVMGDTKIDKTTLLSGAMLDQLGLTGQGFGDVKIERVAEGEEVVLDGDFEDIILDCPAEVSVTDDTTVGHLTVSESGEGASVDVEEGCCIEEFEANAEAQVTGDGQVESAVINCCGVEIEQEVAEVTLGDDVPNANVGGKTVEESTEAKTTSGGGGGSSRVDRTAPTLSGFSIDGIEVQNEDVFGFAPNTTFSALTATMSENVTLTAGEEAIITIDGSEFGIFTVSGKDLSIMPTNDNEWNYVAGEFQFDLAEGTIRDAYGNTNEAISLTLTFEEDTTAPTATVTESGNTIIYTFSERIKLISQETDDVTALNPDLLGIYAIDGGDYENEKKGTINTATLEGNVLTVTFTGPLTPGNYIMDAWGYSITDLAGNRIEFSEDQVFTEKAPTLAGISIDETAVGNGDTVSFGTGTTFGTLTATMSENVSLVGGATANVTIEGVEFGTFTVDGTDLLITPTNDNGWNYVAGEFTFDLAAGTIEDEVGNTNEDISFTLTFEEEREVATAEELRDALNDDNVVKITVTSTEDYQPSGHNSIGATG